MAFILQDSSDEEKVRGLSDSPFRRAEGKACMVEKNPDTERSGDETLCAERTQGAQAVG